MAYNFTNSNDISKFVKDNIKDYLNNKKNYTYKKYVEYFKQNGSSEVDAKEKASNIPTGTEIEVYLSSNLSKILKSKKSKNRIDTLLKKINSTTIKDIEVDINKISIKMGVSNKELEQYYYNKAINILVEEWMLDDSKYRNDCMERLLSYQNYLSTKLTSSESVIVNRELKKSFPEIIEILFRGGFLRYLDNVDTGVNQGTKRSNEGDAAQFLFVARAILAGFSCSNVDVRTSPYDAVIDFENYLLRVQIKGIDHDVISFMTATRGGAGADTTAPTNKPKKITRDDCDLYVAVEKSNAICYIIPIEDVEDYLNKGVKRLPSTDKDKYKENWNMIEIEAKRRFRLK